MMEESSADTDRNQCLARLRAQRHRAQQRRDNPRRSQRLASQREFEARHHEQESLLEDGISCYAFIIIWLFPLPELTGLLP